MNKELLEELNILLTMATKYKAILDKKKSYHQLYQIYLKLDNIIYWINEFKEWIDIQNE